VQPSQSGGPEIQLDCVVYNNHFSAAFQAASGIRLHASRNTAKNGWIPISSNGQELFQWYFDENHGSDYFLQVGEMDAIGGTQKLTVGITSRKKKCRFRERRF
jgi:hypothetical protein